MSAKQNRRTIMAFPADTHCGSTVGLIPMQAPWQLVDEGLYIPNQIQSVIGAQWEACWKKVRSLREADSRLLIFHVGDAVEGIHHNAMQYITPRIDEHQRMHVAAMKYAMQLSSFDKEKGDKLFYVTGTPAHTSPGSASEEIIARAMEAEPQRKGTEAYDYADGRYTWDRIVTTINGVKFDIAHEGSCLGSRVWTRGNSLRLTLKSLYYDCLEQGVLPPRYYIRAHRHSWANEVQRGQRTTVEGFLLPCFQGTTEYAYKLDVSSNNIGMLIIVIEPTGDPWWTCERISFMTMQETELE